MSLPEFVRVGAHRFPLHMRRSRDAERLSLRFHPLRDALYLTLPKHCSAQQGMDFVDSRRDWLRENLGPLPPRIPLTFGETIPVLGKPVTIKQTRSEDIEWKKSVSTRLPSTARILAVPAEKPSHCEEQVRSFLEQKLYHYILNQAEEMATDLGKKVRRVVLRDMVTRWGSCTRDGTLAFSWRLIFAPKPVLDYIIAHEAAHLRKMNHSDAFWEIVASLHPSYDRHREWLRLQSHVLYRYGQKLA